MAKKGQQARSNSNRPQEKRKLNYLLRIQQSTENTTTSQHQKASRGSSQVNDENSQRNKQQQQTNQSSQKSVQNNRMPLKDITNQKTMNVSKLQKHKQELIQLKSTVNQLENKCNEYPVHQIYTHNFTQRESYSSMSSICPQAFTKQYFSSLIVNQSDVQDCLKRHHINSNLRPKMIDWMIEVIACIFKKPTITSLFRAVNLMDLFLKKSSTLYTDQSVHLIGVSCLLICNHFDQCREITVGEFQKDVAHESFEKKDIVSMEIQILKTIDHNLNFSVASDFNNQYIFFLKKSQRISESFIINITNLSYFYLLQSYFFEEILSFQPRIIALAAFFVALETLFASTKENNQIIDNRLSSIVINSIQFKLQTTIKSKFIFHYNFSSFKCKYHQYYFLKQQKAILGEFNEGMDSLMPSLAFCIKNIKIISNNFKLMHPKMVNYQIKFSQYILN